MVGKKAQRFPLLCGKLFNHDPATSLPDEELPLA
jgi:hypothetical protein